MILNTLKAKLIAAGSLVLIALFAALKWLYASNKAKAEKIQELKNEAKVAKEVTHIENDVAEYKGYQEAINKQNKNVAEATQRADDERGEVDGNSNDQFTAVSV